MQILYNAFLKTRKLSMMISNWLWSPENSKSSSPRFCALRTLSFHLLPGCLGVPLAFMLRDSCWFYACWFVRACAFQDELTRLRKQTSTCIVQGDFLSLATYSPSLYGVSQEQRIGQPSYDLFISRNFGFCSHRCLEHWARKITYSPASAKIVCFDSFKCQRHHSQFGYKAKDRNNSR